MSLTTMMRNCLTLDRHRVVDGLSGGQAPSTWTTDARAVDAPCSIQPASANTMLKYLQNNMRVSHTLYFGNDWNPNVGDRWRQVKTGRCFIVMGWTNPLERPYTWVCDCWEQRVPLAPGVNDPPLGGVGDTISARPSCPC